MNGPRVGAWLAAALLAGACAPLQPARPALPPELADAPALALPAGAAGSAGGGFDWQGLSVRFERRVDGWRVGAVERRRQRLQVTVGDGVRPPRTWSCDGGDLQVEHDGLTVTLRPSRLHCRLADGTGELRLSSTQPLLAAPRHGGWLKLDGVRLAFDAEHRPAGSAWPAQQALGYSVRADGRLVALLSLAGHPPLLHRAALPPATEAVVLHAALLLALAADTPP